jgi:hypothetical protein
MDDCLMSDPVDRRRWLFEKALETAPLSEALALAQAAEAFLTGTMEHSLEVTSAPTFEIPPKTQKPQQQVPNLAAQDYQPLATSEPPAGLTSLVSIDQVISYLRQGGDTVLAESESADELLARANLKRTEQGLPPFALSPTSPRETAQQDKADQAKNVTAPRPAAAPRPLNARERAALARDMISLAAD